MAAAGSSVELPRVIRFRGAFFLVLGMVVGSGIYRTPASIAESVADIGWIVALWAAGGVVTLTGAMCYAELTTTYPRSGGDYYFLRSAYGEWAGFLFGWTKMFIVRPVTIAVIAIIAAEHTLDLFEGSTAHVPVVATVYIVCLSALNIAGTKASVGFNTGVTILKLAGLALIVSLGWFLGEWVSWAPERVSEPSSFRNLPLALIAVMWAYGGANELAMVSGEVTDPQRSLLRSLIYGTLGITAIYLLAVVAFHSVVTPEELAAASERGQQPITLIVERTIGNWLGDELGSLSGKFAAVLVILSALGTTHTMILSGGRIVFAFSGGVRGLRGLHHIHRSWGTPARAVVFLAVVACAFCWFGGFDQLIAFSGFGDWFLYILTAIALVILRRKDSAVERPFRVNLTVVWPIYLMSCLALFGSAVASFWQDEGASPFWWIGPLLLVVGLGLYPILRVGGSTRP